MNLYYKYFFMIILFWIRTTASFSHDINKFHQISLITGVSKNIERDDAMSQFKYKGYSAPFEIGYKHNGNISHLIFYAGYDKQRLTSSLPDYGAAGLIHYVNSTNIQIAFSYLLRTIKSERYRIELYLGAELGSLINLRQQAYCNNNEFLMLDQFNSLGFTAQLEKQFANNRQKAVITVNIPLISYMLMGNTYNAYVGEKIDGLMNYNGNMLSYLVKKGDFVSFGKLVCFKSDISFTRFLSKNIGIEIKHTLRYYKVTQYKELNYSKNLQNSFLAGIVFKL